MNNSDKIRQNIQSSVYNALRLKYLGDIETARATMLIYFNNPVAIGEHPQHLEEMDTLLTKMVDGNDKLTMLQDKFEQYNGEICGRRASP